jgi:hypothetical protein
MSACCTAGVRKAASSMVTATLVSALALAAIAGCTLTRGKPASSAARLQHNANVLASDVLSSNYASDPRGYAHDAHNLSEDAKNLREALSEGSPDNPEVRAAFERVSQSYQTLHDAVEQSDNHEARKDLKRITEAYLDVEHKIGG